MSTSRNESSARVLQPVSQVPAQKDGSFTCTWPVCKETKTFSRNSEFVKHMDKHTRPYTCLVPPCNGTNFGDKAGLLRHEREKHQPARFFCQVASCTRNRRGFARKRNLDTHIKSQHLSTSATASLAPETSKSPDSMDSPDGSSENQTGSGHGEKALGRVHGIGGLQLKLAELESRKAELASCQLKLDEDILAVKRTMELVSPA